MHRLPISFLIPVVKSLPAASQTLLLESGGLRLEQLYRAEGKIDVDLYDTLAATSAVLSRNPAVGLLQGRLADLRQLGLVALVLMNAATLGEAFTHFQRYNALLCTGISYELAKGTDAVFSFVNTVPGRVVPRVVADSVLASFVRLLSQLVDGPIRVLGATVPHAESEPGAYLKALGVVPEFSLRLSLTVEASLLGRPIAFADAELLNQFRARADQLLGPSERPTVTRLRRLLASRCGQPTKLAEASRELALGVRTLQEHLKQEGTTFQAVTDDFRRDFASAELRRHDHSLAEIAWLLGYSEQGAFQAAFKRWTGKTPLEFRNGEARTTPVRQKA